MRPVCFIVDPLHSNSMKSRNPHSGFHRENVSMCLDTSTQNPIRNGGGAVIVQPRHLSKRHIADDGTKQQRHKGSEG